MPFCGIRKITVLLRRAGYVVNRKRVARLMRRMGLEAQYPKPRLSQVDSSHRVYPYLLRGLSVDEPNQVWAADITYIPMAQGFCYLVAIMDWASRYVLSWRVSTRLDTMFCMEALEEALQRYGAPEIVNTDQGSQFTSQSWVERLEAAGVRVSMDGKGRYLDNIFVERLWRSVKYEDLYLNRYETVPEVKAGLRAYFDLYNHRRPHQSLSGLPPAEVYAPEFKKAFKSLELLPQLATFEHLFEHDDDVKQPMERLRA